MYQISSFEIKREIILTNLENYTLGLSTHFWWKHTHSFSCGKSFEKDILFCSADDFSVNIFFMNSTDLIVRNILQEDFECFRGCQNMQCIFVILFRISFSFFIMPPDYFYVRSNVVFRYNQVKVKVDNLLMHLCRLIVFFLFRSDFYFVIC